MLPYNIKDNTGSSAKYYQDVSEFAEHVLGYAEHYHGIVRRYKAWTKKQGREVRTDLEYILELLCIGVFWQAYQSRAAAFLPCKGLLINAARWRRRGGVTKILSDGFRAILLTKPLGSGSLDCSATGLYRLIRWMQATGEFEQECQRLLLWSDWLQEDQGEFILSALEFAAWFEAEASKYLGEYTRGYKAFAAEAKIQGCWREDVILRGRRESEYFLNMVGSEMLNWAYRYDFLKTQGRVVLAPRCMQKAGSSCKAEKTDSGYKCRGCLPDCQIHKLTVLGKQVEFAVYIIPHESETFAKWQQAGSACEGVVGIACVTTLLDGGLKARSLGIPAQCVLLDSCGCKHWCNDEKVTTIRMERLAEILDIDKLEERYIG